MKLQGHAAIAKHVYVLALQCASHIACSVLVVVIPKDGEPAEWRFEARKRRSYRVWWDASAAEYLHVNVIAAEQCNVGSKTRSLGNDCVEARNVAQSRNAIPWIELDRENFKGRVITLPRREDIQTPAFNEQLIVELYSK